MGDETTWKVFQNEPQSLAFIAECTIEGRFLPAGWPSGGNLFLRVKSTAGGVSPRIHPVAQAMNQTGRIPINFDLEQRRGKVVGLWGHLNHSGNAKAAEVVTETGAAGVFLVAEPAQEGQFSIRYKDGVPKQEIANKAGPGAAAASAGGGASSNSSSSNGTGSGIVSASASSISLSGGQHEDGAGSFLPVQGRLRVSVGFLKKEAYHRHEWMFGAFAELIHNASDANATEVRITPDQVNGLQVLRIQDNGDGMNKEEIDIMMQLGRRQGRSVGGAGGGERSRERERER